MAHVTESTAAATARDLAERLGLEPHPEGGRFRRTWTHPSVDDAGRPLASSILYLLGPGEHSHWHRIDAVELWQHLEGDPLLLSVSGDRGAVTTHRLAHDDDAQLQVEVPAGSWQAARPASDDGWCLVSCVVVPAFVDTGFELAPPGWSPPAAHES